MDSSDRDADVSTALCRSRPGSRQPRASSRSLDTAENFKGFQQTGSTPPSRSGSRRSTSGSSVCSLESLPEPPDDEAKDDHEEEEDHWLKSLGSVSLDSSDVFTFDPLDLRRRSNRSMKNPPIFSGPEEFNPRSPSRVTSRDSGITGSSGLSTLSIRKELRRTPLPAGPDDVACNLCTGNKLKAWKSCLTCVRSFCEEHGRDHYRYKEMEQHQLVEVTKDLNIYKENAELKQMIRVMREENRVLRMELKSLKQGGSTPSLPAYICQGKTPTAADVILDPETAHRTLVLSPDGKRVRMGQKSKVQSGPQRFDKWECVLAKNGFRSGRHYWQVEVNKEFTIGLMKSSAERKGRFDFTPVQGYWCIFHFWLSFSALENHVVRLPINSVPQVLGVCVDVDERWVTFYNVETKDLIYIFKDMKLAPGDELYPIFRTVERSMDLLINTVSRTQSAAE